MDKYYKMIYKHKGAFGCRKGFNRNGTSCNSVECYPLENLSRKCKMCGHLESVTANTAFEGVRKISLSDIIKVLSQMQNTYLKYVNYRTLVEEKEGDKKTLQELSARLTCKQIGETLKIKRENAWRFLKRITNFLPDDFEYSNPEPEWFERKSADPEPDRVYLKLFGLLFRNDGLTKRNQSEIIGILSNKQFAENAYYF